MRLKYEPASEPLHIFVMYGVRRHTFNKASLLSQALAVGDEILTVDGDTPTPYTLHPTPYTLHPIHPTPCPLHPAPYTLHPTPYTLHPTPHTLHPTPYTLHPTPHTLHPTPHTLHPTPYTPQRYVGRLRAHVLFLLLLHSSRTHTLTHSSLSHTLNTLYSHTH